MVLPNPLHILSAKNQSVLDCLQDLLPGMLDAAQLLEDGGVWFGKKLMQDPSFELESGQALRVFWDESPGARYAITQDQVIFEDDNLLAVFKPNGVVVGPTHISLFNNLSYGVGQYLGEGYSPPPITRLDKLVSGLVLYPKNKAIEKGLFRLTRDRKIQKWYVATIWDKPGLPQYKRVKTSLDFGQRAFESETGKPAHSLFIRRSGNGTEAEYSVFIFTGRRHQIRVHAAKHLAPIWGDRPYGGRRWDGDGIALRCAGYNFTLAGKRYRIRIT